MDSAQFWFQDSGDTPTPTPGGDIPNSLRFRGGTNASLTRAVRETGARTWTFSCWVKKTDNGDLIPLFTPMTGVPDSFGLRFTVGPGDNLGYETSGGRGIESTAVFRDPGAWYHVVCRCDFATSLMTIFVNGEQVAQGATVNTPMSFSGNMMVGASANTSAPNSKYMADVYLVEQALEPTAFGRELTTGQWVPREVDFTPRRDAV